MRTRPRSAGPCRMTRFTMRPNWKKAGVGVLVAVFWIGVWQLLSLLVGQELLLPSPMQVLARLWELMGTADFWKAAGWSLGRVVLGFAAAVAAGCVLAVLTARFAVLRTLFAPLLHIVRAAPVASFIILALVWIRTGFLPAFISFLMVLPMVWANVEQGIRQTDRGLLEMAKVYRLGGWKTFWRVRVPSVMPYFLAACTTGLGFAWKSGIAAEVICRPSDSVGNYLQEAKLYLETPSVFAWTVTVVALSVLLEQALLAVARRYGRRYNL